MILPLSYVTEKIYSHCNKVTYKNYKKQYNFECPICNEGKSKGRKKRGYYFCDNHYFYCHNCQQNWSDIDWIKIVTGSDERTILQEAKEYQDDIQVVIDNQEKKSNNYSLPKDCINLLDHVQINYYKNNPYVISCLKYMKDRRLVRAINRPPTFYTTFCDYTHKNRLLIPFYDDKGKIVFYQSRAVRIEDENKTKYLSKSGGIFSVFGINQIDPNIDYFFIFEGPIDSMFVRNGIAIGGLYLNDFQKEQLDKYPMYKKIFVLDNQLNESTVRKKYIQLIEEGERIFIWPKSLSKYKDLNELCCDRQMNSINPEFFVKHSYSGMQARLFLKK